MMQRVLIRKTAGLNRGVNLRRRDVRMAQHLLNRPQICPTLE